MFGGIDVRDEATLEKKVREASKEGRLACAVALRLADELGVPPREIGRAADRLGIKIVGCQLGCFG